jgi:hypothetical protein
MFCPKCGNQNPDTGQFCRSCGTDLGNVSTALASGATRTAPLVNHRGKPIHWESAISKLFLGAAFLVVSIVLGVSGMGRGWWFWMLIPAFSILGGGIAQYIQLKKAEQSNIRFVPPAEPILAAPPQQASLPQSQTPYVSPESRYKTGDLVPPSVTDSTTRHLELDKEGETMALPKGKV